MRLLLYAFLMPTLLQAEEEGKYKGVLGNLAKHFLGEDGGDRFFYYPTKTGPLVPDQYGYQFEEVTFPSRDEVKLHGWFLPAHDIPHDEAKGTVVFSHGNTGAIGYHLGFCTWLVKAGYHVLIYDYRGFGKSEGKVDRAGMVADVQAAFQYVSSRDEVDATKLFSFGHSLGGAKSIASIGETSVPGLRGVISFAGFSSYKKMAERMTGKAGAQIVTSDYAPREYVAKIAPVPLLIVHGEADRVVPFEQAKELFERAEEPKTFFAIKDGTHSGALWHNEKEYIIKVLAWMDQQLKSPPVKPE